MLFAAPRPVLNPAAKSGRIAGGKIGVELTIDKKLDMGWFETILVRGAGNRPRQSENYCEATRRATVSSLSKIMLLVSSSGNTTGSSFFAV